MLSDDEVLARFDGLRSWSREGSRAPHKPLLLLLMLTRIQQGQTSAVSFTEIEEDLERLLRDYGPPRQSYHPEYPFWRLQNDGVWVVANTDQLVAARGDRIRQGDVPRALLRAAQARAHLPQDLLEPLQSRPALLNRLTFQLLDAHFPVTLHEDILDAVGMKWMPDSSHWEISRRLARDDGFRDLILDAYDERCAICGYDGALLKSDGGKRLLGIEAAHIWWHAAKGPDSADNGLALCSLHHTLLDSGALGLTRERQIRISRWVIGSSGIEEWLTRYEGRPLRAPRYGYPPPAERFIDWHSREVFKAGPPPASRQP